MLGLKSREKPMALIGTLRQSVLAWVGALSVIQEEFEGWAKHLIERGELAESEGRQFIKQLVTQHRKENTESQSAAKQSRSSIREKLMDWCLSRMGRPTNKETRELSQRIEALEARIAKLAAL